MNSYDGCLKNVSFKIKEILSSITLSNETHIFFKEAHVKEAIRDLNKSFSSGSDKITPELIQNGRQAFMLLLHFITRLLSFSGFS